MKSFCVIFSKNASHITILRDPLNTQNQKYCMLAMSDLIKLKGNEKMNFCKES